MAKKKGGRPIKEEEKKANKQVHIRLTTTEKEQLVALENYTGYSRTELFKLKILNQSNWISSKELVENLASIGGELGKIGSNINQLARHANTVVKSANISPAVVEEFNSLMKVFLQKEKELHTNFRQIYREMKG